MASNRPKYKALKAAFLSACDHAKAVAELNCSTIKVVIGRGGESPKTAIHIQGNAVTDYIWEQMARKGRRFRVLRVFDCSQRQFSYRKLQYVDRPRFS